jgi:Holliday junction DNA helicase RuvA
MIASLEGTLAAIKADHVVVVVNGVGYKVFAPVNVAGGAVDNRIFLWTYLIVREDALTLYGFNTEAERDMFEKLISVSGVGPRTALAVLSTMSLDRLITAIASGSVDGFARIPGVGKKTAEKIIFELKNRIGGGDGLIPASNVSDVTRDVLEALIGLGYSASESQLAIRSIPGDVPDDFEERLRRALQYFI